MQITFNHWYDPRVLCFLKQTYRSSCLCGCDQNIKPWSRDLIVELSIYPSIQLWWISAKPLWWSTRNLKPSSSCVPVLPYHYFARKSFNMSQYEACEMQHSKNIRNSYDTTSQFAVCKPAFPQSTAQRKIHHMHRACWVNVKTKPREHKHLTACW